MKYYTKQTLATKPDAVIIHVGTNDIKNSSPEKVAESMLDLGKDIKQDCGKVELIFSTIITRTDVLSLNAKINCYNSLLDTFYCKLKVYRKSHFKRQFSFIKNTSDFKTF